MRTDFEHYPDVEVAMPNPSQLGVIQKAGLKAGTWSLEFVEPETAAHYLEDMSWNREKHMGKINRYAQSITEGKWRLTHQGIAFDESGRLCDGQHRLHAVVKAGKGIWVWVYRGLATPDKIMLDRGYLRTDKVLLEYSTGHKLSHRQSALAKALVYGMRGMAPEEALATAYEKYKEALDWCDATFKSSACYFIRYTVLEALIRARYHEPHSKIDRFCDILKGEIALGDWESAAVKLRELLLASGKRRFNQSEWLKLRMQAESAIRSFVRGQPVKRLTIGTGHIQTANGPVLYTLPGEGEQSEGSGG